VRRVLHERDEEPNWFKKHEKSPSLKGGSPKYEKNARKGIH
jgi:hypothetical protein